MKARLGLAVLVAIMLLGITAAGWAQERPARDTPQPAAPARPAPRDPPPPLPAAPTPAAPSREAPAAAGPVERAPVAEARLVVITIDPAPAQPIAGGEIQALVVIENQGTAASQARARLVVRCSPIPREPICPGGDYEEFLPVLAPGQRHRATIPLRAAWSAGRYRLHAALDRNEARPHEVELVIHPPAAAVAARVEPRPEQPARGESRELNPQPEPPSARAEREPSRVANAAAGRAGDAPGPRPAAPPPAMAPPPNVLAPTPGIVASPLPPKSDPAADDPGPAPEAVPAAAAGAPVMGTSAQLAFVAPTLQGLTHGPTESTIYKNKEKVWLFWSSPFTTDYQWRWQVALWQFPQNASLTPPALLQDGAVPAANSYTDAGTPAGDFQIDLGSFPPLGEGVASPIVSKTTGPAGEVAMGGIPPAAPTGGAEAMKAAAPPMVSEKPPSGELPPAIDQGADGPSGPSSAGAAAGGGMNMLAPEGPAAIDVPMDFYIRLIPIKDGQPAGPPSNAVVVHYMPGPDPNEISLPDYEKEKAELLAQAIVFDVEIVSIEPPVLIADRWGCIIVVKNPHALKVGHPLFGYFEGGGDYCPKKDPQYYEKDWDEKFWEAVSGWGKAWDGASWFLDQAKGWLASQFAEAMPCEWLGDDLEQGCEAVAAQVAHAAITAGLVAAGVPPSIPNLSALGAMAEGEVVEAAVDYTCEVAKSNNHTCTAAEREALAKLYQEIVDKLQEDQKKQAQEPDCGDVQTAKEKNLLALPCFSHYPGTEVKPAPGAVTEPVELEVRVTRIKPDPDFLPACQITAASWMKSYSSALKTDHEWQPFHSLTGGAPLPPLTVGQSVIVPFALHPKPIKFMNHTPAETWWDLYSGGQGSIGVSVTTLQGVGAPYYLNYIACSKGDSRKFQVPPNAPFDWKTM